VSSHRDKGHRDTLRTSLVITRSSISGVEFLVMARQRGESTTLPLDMISQVHYEDMRAERDYYVELIIKSYLDATLY
ncbi:hypothetical protein KI387_008176, partial [Taxus chinensis]